MFIGHYALAFAAKKATPRTNLGALLLAVSWCDIVWPVFLLLGWERVRIHPGDTAFTPLDFQSYPWSHSLLVVVGWSALLGAVAFAWKRDSRGAFWIGALVASHWMLDWISHRPDMPLWPAGPCVGLGLWNHVGATLGVESLLFIGGVFLYLRATRAKHWVGHLSLWSFLIVVSLMYLSDASGRALPPSEKVLAWVSFIGWLPPLWGLWIERSRELLPSSPRA